MERDRRSRALRLCALLELVRRGAALVVLGPEVAVTPNLEVQPLGEGVDDRDADAVEASGDLVATALAELAPGVEGGHHDLGGRLLLLRVHVDGNAAAVVDDGDAVVRMQRDEDLVAEAGDRLVDGVVDDLVDQVVKATRTGGPDVHTGTLADRLEALEDGDVPRVIGVPRLLRSRLGGLLRFGRVCLAAARGGPLGLSLRHSVPFAHVTTNPDPAGAATYEAVPGDSGLQSVDIRIPGRPAGPAGALSQKSCK